MGRQENLTRLELDVVVNEKDVSDSIEYETFLRMIRTKDYNVDLSYMSEHKVKDVPINTIGNFNAALMACRMEYGYSVCSILTKISQEFIDPVKIKSYINTDVKWELIDEIRKRYPKLKDEYADTDTDLLF